MQQFKKIAEVMKLSYEELYFAESDFTIPQPQDEIKIEPSKNKRNMGLFLSIILVLIVIFGVTAISVVLINQKNNPLPDNQPIVSNDVSTNEKYIVSLDVNGGNSLSVWKFANDYTLTAKWMANEYDLVLINSNNQVGSISESGIYGII